MLQAGDHRLGVDDGLPPLLLLILGLVVVHCFQIGPQLVEELEIFLKQEFLHPAPSKGVFLLLSVQVQVVQVA